MADKTLAQRDANLAGLTQAVVKQRLSYDPVTGVFTWALLDGYSHSRAKLGEKAGHFSNGYIVIGMNGKKYPAHILAWIYMLGAIPPGFIDHKNGDRSDCRWSNLRLASRADNNRNSVVRSHSKVGIKGVQKHRTGRFVAKIQFGGKQFYLGIFDTAAEAGLAYEKAANAEYGQFARLK